jgi:hypothetical protein
MALAAFGCESFFGSVSQGEKVVEKVRVTEIGVV